MELVNEVREVVELVEAMGDLALYKRVLDVERHALDLTNENFELQRQIKLLQEQATSRSQLVLKAPGKYYHLREDGTEEGPVCPSCYDEKGLVIGLACAGPSGSVDYCRACKTRY